MTTTITTAAVCDNSTLANFKAWAQVISGALSTLGWVQTSDTGQINWGTISSVPSSTYVYEIWRANDALQSTMPIFIKIEYGFSSTSVRMRIAAGTSTNGSGSLTGQGVAAQEFTTSGGISNQGAGTFPCYFSGSAGEFRMYMWAPNTPNTGTLQSFLFIERSKNTSGVDTGDYVSLICFQSQNATLTTNTQVSWTTTGTAKRNTGVMGLGGNTNAASGADFGTVAAFPVFPIIGKVGNPMLGMMTAYAADIVDQSTVTVASLYGSTHTYLAFGNATIISAIIGARSNNSALMAGLMRFE